LPVYRGGVAHNSTQCPSSKKERDLALAEDVLVWQEGDLMFLDPAGGWMTARPERSG
jgi:hypothetical protein